MEEIKMEGCSRYQFFQPFLFEQYCKQACNMHGYINMNVEYKRDLNKNYMIISPQGAKDGPYIEDYQLKMIKNNNINGLLNMTVNYTDNIPNLTYEITSHINMNDMFLKEGIDFNALKKFQTGIHNVMEKLKEYLLSSNHILLNPKYIYIDLNTLCPKFCYYPFAENDFYLDMGQLYKEIIKMVNYEDKEAVQLAYGLENLSMNDTFTINQVNALIAECTPIADMEKKSQIRDNSYHVDMGDDDTDPNDDKITKDGKKSSLFNIIGKFKSKESDGSSIYQNSIKTMNKVHEDYIADNFDYKSPSNETNLLYENDDYKLLLLCLTPKYENVVINTFPCIIGKQEGKVDKIIPCQTVSRIHCKIIEKDGCIYLEDLNSTNGTFINEKPLQPHEKERLKNNDILVLGEIRYKAILTLDKH